MSSSASAPIAASLTTTGNGPTITASPTTTGSTLSTTASRSTTRDGLGGFSDPYSTASSSASPSSNPDSGSMGLINYYYIFFAIILCIAGLAGFFFWKRRKMLLGRHAQNRTASQGWGPQQYWNGYHGRQHWNERGISNDDIPVEGLNEHGEAPPPYVPKSDEEARRRQAQNNTSQQPEANTIPMQDLSNGADQRTEILATVQSNHTPPSYEQTYPRRPSQEAIVRPEGIRPST